MVDLSPQAGVAIGIIVGLLSTCVQSIGLTLQRKSHMLEDEKANSHSIPQRPPYRRRRWQIGMLLFLVANIVGSTIQITTLPLPLLSTLQASGLVFNSILASLLLKERWTWRTGWGTLLVAGGAVLISLFSAVPEPSHNLRQLVVLLQKWNFLVWFILSLVFVLAVLIMDFVMRKCVADRGRDVARIQLVRGMSYGMVSGILSAHALLLAKSAVELIVRSLADHRNQFSSYQSWLLLLAFLVLALSQLYYLHLGLKLISTSILYPFVFCIYNIVAILDGLIYFRQLDRLPPLHAGLIALGTVILLSGVLALSWRLKDEEADGEHHRQMLQAEIPQTLLAPGSGFVADPEDDDTNESAIPSDDDEEEDDEESQLLNRRARSKSGGDRSTAGPSLNRRRKRAHTLKEFSQLWYDLHSDDGEDQTTYGAIRAPISNKYGKQRSSSAAHIQPRRQRSLRRRSSPGTSLQQPGTEESDLSSPPTSLIQRAKTMPPPRRPASGKRRTSGYEGGALFSDMLKKDWWWRWRRDNDDNDDGGEEDGDDEDEPSLSAGGRGHRRLSGT